MLEEVSGLSWAGNEQVLLVQDEIGTIFLFDLPTGEINYRYRFRTKGDFEGVEVVGKDAYALRSDGCIYEIKNFRESEKAKVIKHDSFLTANNDTEGLGLSANGKSILVACKSSASTPNTSYKGNRSIYTFDLNTKTLQEKPSILINLDELEEITGKEDQRYRPSGVAVHPHSKEVYTIASSGQLLVVTNRDGSIKWVKRLDNDIFRQPEGICFDPQGNLYISNEGRGKKGNILVFPYQK